MTQGLTGDHLRFKLYSIQQELLRTKEELCYLPQDAIYTLGYFQEQQQILGGALRACEAALGAASTSWEGKYLRGRLHILASWQAHISCLHKAAWLAFLKAGWIAAPEP